MGIVARYSKIEEMVTIYSSLVDMDRSSKRLVKDLRVLEATIDGLIKERKEMHKKLNQMYNELDADGQKRFNKARDEFLRRLE